MPSKLDHFLISSSNDSELIPLMTQKDEDNIYKEDIPETILLLPLRNTVLFPGVVIPITVNRDSSINLINKITGDNKIIGVVAQKNERVNEPKANDIYKIGTVSKILKVLRMPDGNMTVILQGKRRFKIEEILEEKPFLNAKINCAKETYPNLNDKEFEALIEAARDTSINLVYENPDMPSEASTAIKHIESGSFLTNFCASNLNLSVSEKQKILNIDTIKGRAMAILREMNVELQKLRLKNTIQSKVRTDIDQQQREFFLHQQIKTIQEELGETGSGADIKEFKEIAKKKKWTKKVAEHFEKELKKLQLMNPQMAEYSIQRNYLSLLTELPWNKFSTDKYNLKQSEKILNTEHYGLEEIKKRILEHLAVLKLRKDMKSPILCLDGPPGVGKTSLGKSIAKSMGRKYVRISLGGLHDEAEIRGHRKTYIGAMPGRLIQNIKNAGTSNPVFLLDEIDKIGQGHTSDPSSALLEVLDPEQNKNFHDNFLEIGYDLSNVLFIATSNNIADIQPALRDRMEIIHLSGYTIEEKIEIASKHILKKQLEAHGLEKNTFKLSKTILSFIIENYTRESGVRNLEKKIGAITRNITKRIVSEEPFPKTPSEKDIIEILGPPKFNYEKYDNNEIAGVVTGLAWTSVGGDILFIESILSKGKGNLALTGNLGKVMEESAKIALEYLKANASLFGINNNIFENYNFHIHVPEGATPKDGPSAGITILTSLVSLLTQKRVKKNIAMTGEITLRGKVLPVGGIKEKLLAGKRAKIKEFIFPKENQKDIEKINEIYWKGLTIHFVENMTDVIKIAITDKNVINKREFNI